MFKTALIALAAAALLAAGCGSSSSNQETTSPEAAAKAWAGGVCVSFQTWKDDIKAIGSDLKANPTLDNLQQSVTDAKTATSTLDDTLQGIGKPPTAASDQAKTIVDDLRSQLKQQVDAIKSAVDAASGVSSIPTTATTVKTAVETMKTEVESARQKLKALPQGTLQQGFADAPACQKLVS